MTENDDRAAEIVMRLEAQLTGAGGPYELSGVSGEPGRDRSFVRGPHTLVQLYTRAMTNGAAPLLITDDDRHSYDDIFARSASIACQLPQKSGRIALNLDRPEDWVAGLIAVTGAGAAAVLVGRPEQEAIREAQIASAGCVVLPNDIVCLSSSDQPTQVEFGAPRPDDEAIVLFSSGSTGAPKAIVHTHGTIVAGLNSMMMLGALAGRLATRPAAPMRRSARPMTLLLTPLAYVAGYSALLLAMITGGSVVVTTFPEDPLCIGEAVQRHEVQTIVGLSLDTFTQLVRLPGAERLLSSLRRLQVHGGFLPDGFVAELRDRFPNLQLMGGYGMSETGGAIASAPVERVLGPKDAAGRLSPAVAVRIVDRDGLVLPEGYPGLLEVKGPMLMRGYADAVPGHAGSNDDGWFETGDIGRMWPDRWLEIVSRDDASATIEEAGALRVIEAAALSVNGVTDAVAVRLTSSDIHLFVEQPDATMDDVAIGHALDQAVRGTTVVATHMLPHFDRTGSGKVDRTRLRGLAEATLPAVDASGS